MKPIKIITNVLDDQEHWLILIKELFIDNHLYEINTFSQPEPFLDAISQDIDLVITDIKVDRYDAIETIKLLRKDFPGIYIIVVSAYFTDDIYRQLIHYRVDEAI